MINVEYVKSLTSFTDSFLCDLEDNIYNIKFTKLSIKSISYNNPKKQETILELNINSDDIDENIIKKSKEIKDIYKNPRMIRYHLRKDILDNDLKLTFEYKNDSKTGLMLRMIENHYYNNKQINQLNHYLGFCMPNSKNSQDIIYKLHSYKYEELIKTREPIEIKTDTFFFAGDKLIIHNKTLFYFS